MWIIILVVGGFILLVISSASAKNKEAEAERLSRLELRRKAAQERLNKLTQKYGADIARKLIN